MKKALVDIRLCSRSRAAPWRVTLTMRPTFATFAGRLCVNVKSSIKPEVHNVSQRAAYRTSHGTANMHRNVGGCGS